MTRLVTQTLRAVAHPPAPVAWLRVEIALLVGVLIMCG
jgi:hypothetical protein